MQKNLRIATFNIHKGVTSFNARLVLHEQRDLIRNMQADIVFLQEVRGAYQHHEKRFSRWPDEAQHEFLADEIWQDYAYGKNAVYPAGHHGNALLSKYPIVRWENVDISAHSIEQRGMLHCEIEIPGWERNLHCICVHLGLFARWRRSQLAALREHIVGLMPPQAPLIIAGTATATRQGRCWPRACTAWVRAGQVKSARSFPSVLPMFRLDASMCGTCRGLCMVVRHLPGCPIMPAVGDLTRL